MQRPVNQPVAEKKVTRLADQQGADDQITMLKLSVRQSSAEERW
jgi:hypothetical protein